MNTKLKLLASLAAISLLAACETAGSDTDGAGAGAGYGNGGAATGNVVPGTQSDLETSVGDRVFFAFDSSVIESEAQRTLEGQAAWLKQYPDVDVVIEGHADERGTREYNLALGERRANNTKNYLAGLGVDASRISTISYGKERPAVQGSNESAWAQNRRAVTVVVGR